jgi:hypothetical protein
MVPPDRLFMPIQRCYFLSARRCSRHKGRGWFGWVLQQLQHPHCIALAEHDTFSAVHYLARGRKYVPHDETGRMMKLVTSSRS